MVRRARRRTLSARRERRGPVLQAIHACIEVGRVPTLADLGGGAAVAGEADALVAAPVLDVLLHVAAEAEGEDASILDPIIVRGFREAWQPIPFRDATDVVLTSTCLLTRLGAKLPGVLQLRVEERGPGEAALVAAYALEALFRMALAGTVTLHRPLALMIEAGTDEDGLFAVHAAKLAGAAFHVWRDDGILPALERLAHAPDAEDEAALELGLATLSKALAAPDTTSALHLLEAARAHFDRACTAGGGRDDATAYRATVDVIRGFTLARPPAELDGPLAELEAAVRRRATWLDVANMPEWLRPRLDRDAQWLGLVRLARSVANNLDRSSWLDAGAVMEQVLAVYDADRTVAASPGLDALLRPRVESAFIRERGLLAHLDDLLALQDWSSLRRKSAAVLRARIAAIAKDGIPSGKALRGAPLPLLRGVLQNERLVASLDIKAAEQLEVALADHARKLEDIGHPVVQRVMSRLASELSQHCRDYEGEVKRDFDDLILHVLTFCRDRLDAARKERGPRGEYLIRANATEWDLQSDLRQYLAGNYLRADVRTEVEGVAAGRADIYATFGARRFIIELKRDERDVSPNGLRKYLSQAGSYQGTNVTLGMLGVLDLTARTGPAPHLEENIWTDSFVPEGACIARHLVVFRVTGRLTTPSSI